MDTGELRALQAPLKQRYREAADSARIPARAVGVLDGPELSCRVQARHGGGTMAGEPTGDPRRRASLSVEIEITIVKLTAFG